MKALVLGAGAVGGYFGARLAAAGHEIYFVARGENLGSIGRSGIFVESIKGDFSVSPAGVSEKFQPLPDLDLILVCVKRTDTAGVLDVLKEQTGPNTVVLSLQNGVEVEKEFAGVVSESNVMGGLAFIGSAVVSPGRIKHSASGIITIGEGDGTESPRALKLKRIFDDAGVPCSISKDAVKAKWEKLMWNVGFNGVCALSGRTVHQILSFPPACDLARRLMEECADVAEKLGVSVNRSLIDKYFENGRKGGDVTPSMLQDVRHGKRTEIDFINGKVRDEGAKIKILTPCNDIVWALVSTHDNAR